MLDLPQLNNRIESQAEDRTSKSHPARALFLHPEQLKVAFGLHLAPYRVLKGDPDSSESLRRRLSILLQDIPTVGVRRHGVGFGFCFFGLTCSPDRSAALSTDQVYYSI